MAKSAAHSQLDAKPSGGFAAPAAASDAAAPAAAVPDAAAAAAPVAETTAAAPADEAPAGAQTHCMFFPNNNAD